MSNTTYVKETTIDGSAAPYWSLSFNYVILDNSGNTLLSAGTGDARNCLLSVDASRQDADDAIIAAIQADADTASPPVTLGNVVLLPEFRKIV